MATTAEANSGYVDAFARLANRLAGNTVPWIQQIRKQALSRFSEQGFPTVRDEEWKYTNVTPIQRQRFRITEKDQTAVTEAQIRGFFFRDLPCHRAVFIDGYYAPELSALSSLLAGVTVGSLAATLEKQPQDLESHLGRHAPIDRHGFPALNTAFLVDGAYVHVPRNAVISDPIHILFVSTQNSELVLTQPRNLLVVEEGSRVSVIESYVSLGETRYFTNAVTEVVVGENAAVEHYKLGQESLKAFHIGGLYIQQQRSSRFVSHNFALGGALVRNNIEQLFDDEGSECTLNGLYVPTGRQHVDNHTCIDHARPRCTSREFYRGVLDGHSRAVFNGRVVVHKGAQHTDARQENRNLLLSGDAEVDTKPQLEIYADDVKCAHGVTVGQLDEDAVYYLRSRGLDEKTARNVLTYAFTNDILNRIDIPSIRAHIKEILTARLLHVRRIEDLV